MYPVEPQSHEGSKFSKFGKRYIFALFPHHGVRDSRTEGAHSAPRCVCLQDRPQFLFPSSVTVPWNRH